MRLRPFIHSSDFDEIKNWISDERTHAMWCANLIKYPVEKDNFNNVMSEGAKKFGDTQFVATTDDGEVIGFFCYSTNLITNEGMLKYVLIKPTEQGKGLGKTMLQLAIQYAFAIIKVDAVHLNVFLENTRAKKCYDSMGFGIRKMEIDVFHYKGELWSKCNMVLVQK